MEDVEIIAGKYRTLSNRLDEATLRLWAAVEARTLGRGGVSAVAKAIGISRTTIYAGLSELDSGGSLSEAPSSSERTAARTSISQRRVRAKGGGRKKLTDKDPTLLSDLNPSLTRPAQKPAKFH